MSDHALADVRVVPSNYGPLRGANGNARLTGPCGDTMEFWIRAQNERVARATFTTDGCVHSVLSGSACAHLAEGRTVAEALRIAQQDVLDAVGDLPEESRHCALLAAKTLGAAVANAMLTAEGEAARRATREGQARDEPGSGKPEQGAARAPAGSSAPKGRLAGVRHKILVLSGKGGVGKSTVAVHLALSLRRAGQRVGLLDVDLHGPSIPKMLKLEKARVGMEGDLIAPVQKDGLRVMSIAFLLSDRDTAVIWRGPMKANAIEQLLRDVAWGELDYLVIDCPPGTGDEPLSVCQLVGDADGAVIVTTPQDVATANVRRSIRFCRDLNLPVLGVVENMSGYICPACGESTDIFGSGGGERMAAEMGVPFLGRVPLDPAMGKAGDEGTMASMRYRATEVGRAMERAVEPLLALSEASPREEEVEQRRSR